MAPEKHALFATLTPTTRATVFSAAKDNGLGIDDVIQALLGRWENLGEGARLMAQHLHSEHETEAIAEVMTLAETWPMPAPRPMGLYVNGGHFINTAGMDTAIAYARTRAAEVGERVRALVFDFTPKHDVRVCFFYTDATEREETVVPVTPEDAEVLLPLLVIAKPPAVERARVQEDEAQRAVTRDEKSRPVRVINDVTLVSLSLDDAPNGDPAVRPFVVVPSPESGPTS